MSGVASGPQPVTGIRSTRQRAAIADALAGTEDFCSAQELHEILKARGESIGLTTVYRNLQALSQAGQIDALWDWSGEMRYRNCSSVHHHHLVCRSCAKIVDIDCAVGAAPCLTADDDHGFVIDEAEVTFWGYCPDCAP